MHIRRLGAAVALAIASAYLAAPGSAAVVVPKPQLTDPAGDSIGNQASLDLISATYSTTGITTTTKVRGKTVKTYKPKNLVVTLTLNAPPSTQTGVKYQLDAQVDGCGSFGYSYTPGAATGANSLFTACPAGANAASGGTLIKPDTTFVGNSIVWTVPLAALPSEVKVGSSFGTFTAAVGLAEPVTGVIGTNDLGFAFDTAKSDSVWKLG